jgi:hypothetical protein
MTRRHPDAIEILHSHCRRIEGLFERYRALAQGGSRAGERKRLADEACLELTIHARLAQELVHPAARDMLDRKGQGVVRDSEAAFDALRDPVSRLLAMRAHDPLLDQCMAVLQRFAALQLRHERDLLLPQLRAAGADLAQLGRSLAVRMEELRAVADALREDAIVASLAA